MTDDSPLRLNPAGLATKANSPKLVGQLRLKSFSLQPLEKVSRSQAPAWECNRWKSSSFESLKRSFLYHLRSQAGAWERDYFAKVGLWYKAKAYSPTQLRRLMTKPPHSKIRFRQGSSVGVTR
jgi:hypothetical protein